MNAERWRPVVGYETEYEVSSLGRIRSLVRVLTNSRGITRAYGGKIIALQARSAGHQHTTLSKGGVVTTHLVHVLVCSAFHGPKPDDKDLVAHWDGDPSNNTEGNLRWATHQENEEDKRRHDRHAAGERNPAAKLTADQVAEIRRRYVKRYGAGMALAREFGVSNTQITDIVKGPSWPDDGNATRRKRRRLVRDSGARGTAMGGRKAIIWEIVQ